METQTKKTYARPSEDNYRRRIMALNQDIVHLVGKRDTGLASTEQLQDLQAKKKQLKKEEASLQYLISSRDRQRRKRESDKKIFESNPDLAVKFKRRNEIGRPRIETDQPELLKTIIDIATFGAATDERRRSETLRSVKTLDELTSKLHDQGFKVNAFNLHDKCSY